MKKILIFVLIFAFLITPLSVFSGANTNEADETVLSVVDVVDIINEDDAEAYGSQAAENALALQSDPVIISSEKAFAVIFDGAVPAATYSNPSLQVKSASVILMEASSGRILFEKECDKQLPPASITKIMTMLLIMEALESGKIKYESMVQCSEYAASMGGSQIFLEIGEQMSVSDMLKGIAVSSGNDCCVAMAEFISGSESAFVDEMNKKAKSLGMVNTVFVNCNGLDTDGHFSSARDIALMTQALLKHPEILKYTSIWTDTLRDGAFGLANTNKLVRFYSGANGMKTGFTAKAKYCVSSTALRDGMQLIAVTMGAATSPERFSDASDLLNYGFANWTIFKDENLANEFFSGEVLKGVELLFSAAVNGSVELLVPKGKIGSVEKQVDFSDILIAPVLKGSEIGFVTYSLEGSVLAKFPISVTADIRALTFNDYFYRLFKQFLIG